MEIAAVFILSVIGGWAFAMRWHVTRYDMSRSDGEHTYFRAAFYGVVIYVATLLLRVIAKVYWSSYDELDDTLRAYVGRLLENHDSAIARDVVVTAAISTAVGPAIATVLNLLTRPDWVLRRIVNAQDRLYYDSQRERMPVSLTLANGRVYVGIVVLAPNPDHHHPTITLLPMYSGYRDSTGRLVLTTDYEQIYKAFENPQTRKALALAKDWHTDFELAVRADQVVTATMFIPGVYAHFNPDWRSTIGSRSPPPPPMPVRATIDVASVPQFDVRMTGPATATSGAAPAPSPLSG